jgi:hypothetical protein
MKAPNIKNVMVDEAKKIRYEIIAYRKLTKVETLDAVATLHPTLKKKRQTVKTGETYRILTTYH